MATKSIGSSGRDYATLALYASYLDGLDTLAAAEVGELYNDSEFTPSAAVSFTGYVTSSSNTVTIRPASGQGFKDNAGAATNPLRYDQSKGVGIASSAAFAVGINLVVDYTILDGLQIKSTSVDGQAVVFQNSSSLSNVQVKNCIIETAASSTNGAYTGALHLRAGTAENCCIIQRGNSNGVATDYAGTVNLTNLTVVRPSDITAARVAFRKESGGTVTVKNCAGFGFSNFSTGSGFSGSNNASDQTIGFGSSNQASKTYSSQFQTVTDSSRDFRAKSGGDLLNNGTTGTSTDIIGQSVSGAARDIGAWELQASGAVTFNADQGTVTVTGQNATALLSVALAQGTVAVTGQAATMRYSMAAAQGTVGVTGQASTLTFGMLAGQGTVTITGQDATLTGISGLVLTADTGFVTVTGQDAAMNWSVALAQGAMSVTGQAASVMFGMAAGLGSVSILGQAASVTGATDQSSAVGKPKRSKKRKRVYVGEQVFWSDQKLEIALAVKALQDRRAEERQAKAKKAEQAALTKARAGLGAVVAPSFDFPPVEAQGQAIAAELQGALDLAQEEDDIACLLLCS